MPRLDSAFFTPSFVDHGSAELRCRRRPSRLLLLHALALVSLLTAGDPLPSCQVGATPRAYAFRLPFLLAYVMSLANLCTQHPNQTTGVLYNRVYR